MPLLVPAEEARRQQEHEKLLKQQERLERLEQQRIEKELRAQQMIEVSSFFRFLPSFSSVAQVCMFPFRRGLS